MLPVPSVWCISHVSNIILLKLAATYSLSVHFLKASNATDLASSPSWKWLQSMAADMEALILDHWEYTFLIARPIAMTLSDLIDYHVNEVGVYATVNAEAFSSHWAAFVARQNNASRCWEPQHGWFCWLLGWLVLGIGIVITFITAAIAIISNSGRAAPFSITILWVAVLLAADVCAARRF